MNNGFALLRIIDEGSGNGAVGEVVAYSTLEDVDLEVACGCGPVVPVLGPEVAFEVAAVEVDDASGLLPISPGRVAVEAVEGPIYLLDVGVGQILNLQDLARDEGAVQTGG
jgi:hypothetical protein